MLYGFWLIKVFKIERLRVFFCLFVSHGSTFEVFWPDIATAWCYCTFWMSPEGILLPGRPRSLHDTHGMCPGACSLFCLWVQLPAMQQQQYWFEASFSEAKLRWISWLEPRLALNAVETAVGLFLAQKPWAHWRRYRQTDRPIRRAPWEKQQRLLLRMT